MSDTVDITKGEDIHKRALTYPDSEADRYVDMSHTAYEAKPFYQGTALNRLARDAEWEHEYGYDSPIQQKGVVGLGDSYYDNYVRTEEDLQDLNEVRAREQGFFSKFGSGVGRFAAETLNTGVGNIVGTVVGLYQGIDNLLDEDPNTGFWQGMWHNSVTEIQDEIRKSVEEALPLYKSKAESELGVLSSILTQNFWMELMSSAGFTAGMLVSTALTGGMGVGSAASSLLRAAGASEKAVNFAYRLISGIMGSVSESGMEALNNYNESKQHYTQENVQKYNTQKRMLQQQMESDILKEIMLSNPTLQTDHPVRDYEQESAIKQKYEQMYAEGFAKLDSDFQNGMADIENRALGAGTMTFGLNMAILGLSNSMGTLSFLKAPSANAEREVKKSLFKNLFSPNPSKPLGEGITKAEAKMIGLREGLMEGFEESNQKWASNLAKQYYGSDYDPEATDKFSRFLETSMDTFKNTYTDPETWKEWLMGAITGLSGTFNPGGIVKAAKGEKVGLSDFWQGGVVEAFREGSKLAERSQKAYDEMNKLVTDKKLQDNFRLGVFNLASKQRQMEAAAKGDKFNYENENDGQTIRMIQTFANAGELNTLSALIGNNQNMSDEELNALCEGLCEKNEKKYGDNRYHSEYSFLLTDNGERISDILDNNDPRRKEAKEKIAKESKRIQDMVRTYQKSINEADAKTGYQLEPEKLNFIAWGLTQAKSWEERINSMRDKVGKKYSGILSKITDKFRNYKLDLDSFQEQENNLKQELANIDSEIKRDPDNADLKAQRKDIAKALDDFTKLKENLEEQQNFVEAYGDFISFLNGDTTNERGQKLDGLSVLSSSFLNNASTKENVYQQIASTLQNFSENEIPYQDKKEFLDILKDMNKCANAVHNISNYVNKLMDNPEELQHTFDAFNDDFLNEQIEAYGELYRQSLQNLPAVVQKDDIAAMMKQYDDVMSYYKQQYDKYIQPVEDKLADIESMIADIKATTKDYNRINELQKQKVNYEKRLKELRSFRSKFYAKIRKIKKAAENAMKNLNPSSKELIDAIEETDRLLAEYLPNILDVINSDDAAFREMKTLPVIIRRGEIAYEGQDDGTTKSEYIAKLLDRWQHDKQNEVFAKTKELLFRLIHLAYQNNFSPSLVSDLEFYNIANELGMSLNDVTDTSTLRDRIATVIVKKILDANRNDIKALNPYYSKELVKVDNSKEREDFGVSSVPVNMSEVLQGMAEDVEYIEYTEDGDVVLPKLEPLADLTEEEIAASEEQYKISVARSIVDNVLLEDKKKYVAELANMRRKKANREGLIDRILQVIANDEDTTAEELIKRTRNEIRREKAKEKREAERKAKEKEALEKQRLELKAFIEKEIEEINRQRRELTDKLTNVVRLALEKLRNESVETAENLKKVVSLSIAKLEEQKQSLKGKEKTALDKIISDIDKKRQEVYDALEEAKKAAEEEARRRAASTNDSSYSAEMLSIKEQAIANDTFMKAPNGKPTNLTEKQWLQVRTKAFKDWFGDWEKAARKSSITVQPGETIKIGNTNYTVTKTEDAAPLYHENGLLASRNIPIIYVKESLEFRTGGYIPSIDAIILSETNSDTKTLKHELVHSIEYNVDSNTINPLYEKVKNNISEDSFDGVVSNNFRKSIHEFIADAISSDVFRKALEKEGLLNEVDTAINSLIESNDVSKVVDENGEPLVMYHGSRKDDITIFKPHAPSYNNNGVYFAYKNNRAIQGNKIYEAFLNIKNPLREGVDLIYSPSEKHKQYIEQQWLGNSKKIEEYTASKRYNPQNDAQLRYLRNQLRDDPDAEIWKQYDGIIDALEIVAFNPNQIKSATDNVGTFSNDNNDIYDTVSEEQVFDDSNHTPVLSFTRSTTPQRYGSDGQMHKTEGFENVFALPEIKEAFDFVNSGKLDSIVKSNAKEGLYTRVYVSKKEGFDDVAFLYIKDTSGNNQCIGFISKGKSFIANNIITEDNQYQYGYWTDENGDNHYTSIALPRKDGNKQVGTDIKSVSNQDNSLLSILGTYKSSETISTNYVPLQNTNVGSNDIEKAFDNGDVTIVFIKRASTEMLDIFNDKTFPLKDSDNVVVENSSIPFYVCVYPNTDYSLLRKVSFSVTAIDLANTSVSDIQNGNDEVLKSLLDNFKSLANQLVKISKIKGDVSKDDKSDLGKACFNCMQNLFIPGCTSWYPEFSVNKNTGKRFHCFLNAVDTNQNTIVTFDIPLSGRSDDEMADYIVEQMFIQLQNGGHRNKKVQNNGKYAIERENCIDNGTVIYIKPNIKLSDGERNFSTYMKYYAVNTSEDSNDIGRTNCNYYVGFSGTNEYHQLNPISSYKKLQETPKPSGKTTIGIGNVVYVENDEDSNTQKIVDKDGNELSDSELISLTDPNLIIDSTFDISVFRNKLIYYITSGSKSDVIDINNDFYFDVNTGTIQKRIASNDIDWKEEFKNSTVIWAHPTAGKTTLYGKGDSRVIDFDSVAKPEIAEAFGLPRTTTPKELSQYCTFNATKEVRDRYYNLLYQKFLELAEKAKNEGKKLLVSDMYFIRSKQSDIDMVITMSDEKFASGLAKRGEERNNGWKNNINTQVANYRNAFGKVFNMSDNESEYLEQILDKYIDNQSNTDIQQNEPIQELNLGCQDDDLDLNFREVRSYGDSLNLSEGEYSLSEITKTLSSNEDISQQTIDFISRNASADTKVVVVSNEDFERVREREGKPDILGFYSKSNNTVVIPSAADATTIVHEMAHSATSNMLGYIYRNQENDNNALLISELNSLINDIREAYNNSPSDFSDTNLQYVLSKTGLTATKELFSEILSDKNLQDALARTKANNSSTFMDKVKAFINKLLNAFGFGGKNSEFSSIFDRFNDISNRVENNYKSYEESNTSSDNENTSNEEEEKMSDKEMADFCEKNNYDLQEFKKIPVSLQNEIKKC